MRFFILLIFLFVFIPTGQAQTKETDIKNGQVVLNFSKKAADKTPKGSYTIKRAKGRFGKYETIATTSTTSFVDKTAKGNLFDYYYKVFDSSQQIAQLGLEIELFGENTYIYSPFDTVEAIGREINGIHEQMFGKEFSPNRCAMFFKPGDYKGAGLLKIPYYVQIAGLGRTPYEVEVSNLHTPPRGANGNGTVTFWRSAENLSVIGPETYNEEETFKWAVSQAAPIRRIYSTRVVRYQWGNGWVSGGYTADCDFQSAAGSEHQQQWYTRNSFLNKGRGEFKEIKYNYCFQGVDLGPSVEMSTYQNNWDKGGNVTVIPNTPVIREKPFLFIDKDNRYKVFRPALKHDRKGISYTRTNMGDGEAIDVLKSFFVVKPGTTAQEMNKQLKAGKHLLITPGMYKLSEPLHVTKPNTIILGLGFATLIPDEGNSTSAIVVDDVDGVSVASILFDAHYSSHSLIEIGQEKNKTRHDKNPTVLADLFFRIGGFRPAKVHVDQTVIVNSNDVVGDHFWIWRADHGVRGSVGWDINTVKNGLVVNGDYVTMYGMFVEHFQEYQVYWTGEYGKTYFFQCESPYDAPDQSAYMSEGGTRAGYAAYKVADAVNNHQASAFGIYDVLHNEIKIESSVEVPDKQGIRLQNICNNSLSSPPNRGYGFVINNIQKSTYNTHRDNRTYVVEFVGKEGASNK
ncbi:MAG: glycoside hydrolase family 16 [Mucilaginibacter sp.]|nr:glycoside hydrolase family 16 [Mucilaginibacter sp.]